MKFAAFLPFYTVSMILFLVIENLITLNASDSSVALMVVFAVPKTHVHVPFNMNMVTLFFAIKHPMYACQ